MAKPKNRCNGVCSPLTQPASVRACCCDLKSDYDLTSAIRTASEIFFRLTGRQQQYAGYCTHVVYPCFPKECHCECKNYFLNDGYIAVSSPYWCNHNTVASHCTCDLDFVLLSGACEIERVTINGVIVDPRTYALSGERLLRTDGQKWPMCQALGKDASPISQYSSAVSATVSQVRASRKTNGKYKIFFSNSFVDYSSADAVELVGNDGWKWVFPVESLTHVLTDSSGVEYEFDPNTVHTDFADALSALDGYMVKQFTVKPGQPLNYEFTLDVADGFVRTYSDRVYTVGGFDDPCNTFEIVYRSGCCVPPDVSDAVAMLACELALARCGSESCRLPSKFRLDGEAVSSVDRYVAMSEGLTGLPEVDQVIKSINPGKLYRRGRLVSTPARTVRRFK